MRDHEEKKNIEENSSANPAQEENIREEATESTAAGESQTSSEESPPEEIIQEQSSEAPPESSAPGGIPESGSVINKYETDEQYNKAVNDYRQELDQLVKVAETTYDWKDIRQRISDLREKLKSLFLKEEDHKSFIKAIDEISELVDKRQVDEREKFDKESQENYEGVKDKVDELIKEVAESQDFKTAREKLVKAQDLFRGLRLKKSHRDELFEKVNVAFDELNKRQIEERENFEMETIENYHSLKSIIEDAVEFSKAATNFGKARERLIDAQSQIKGKKLKRDQREELYQVIRENFEALNLRQNEEREQFEEETKVNYQNLRKIVDDAIEFAKNSNDFKQAREQLINAQSAIKDLKLKRSQRDELFGDIRVVFTDLNERQSAERDDFEKEARENYEALTRKVNDAFEQVYGLTDFKMIRDTLISVQGEVKIMKLKKNQRNELFSRIREAFSVFDKKKEEYFDAKRKEKIKKLTDIQESVKEKLDRINHSIERDKEQLEELKGDEEPNENKIKSLEAKIEDKEKSVKSNQARIDDIQKDIDRIVSKMERKENRKEVKKIIEESPASELPSEEKTDTEDAPASTPETAKSETSEQTESVKENQDTDQSENTSQSTTESDNKDQVQNDDAPKAESSETDDSASNSSDTTVEESNQAEQDTSSSTQASTDDSAESSEDDSKSH